MTTQRKNIQKEQFFTNFETAEKFSKFLKTQSWFSSIGTIIEPSSGDGAWLRYLDVDLAYDIDTKHEDVSKIDDFLTYNVKEDIKKKGKVLYVGNPPFGTGYMNPLAKGFFNHSAKFANTIAFIVPAKYHSSWKVHKQLDKSFGLYFTEILPKNSFLMNGKEHNVNCCMQIWSKKKLGKSLRFTKYLPTKHEDFDMFLTCDNVKGREDARDKLRNKQYWEFGLKYWGKISVCDIDDIPINTTTHYLIKSNKPFVRKIFENINWKNYITNMGAPNMGGKSLLVKAYEETKKSIKLDY